MISTGLTKASDARLKLSRLLAQLGYNKPVEYPDIATKAKAQKYIGLDVEELNSEKEKFLEESVDNWIEKAKEREANYSVKKLNE